MLSLLIIFAAAVITPEPTPDNVKDRESLQELVRIWADIADRDIALADQTKTDPRPKLNKLLKLLAANPYFDLTKEAKLHPRHTEFVKLVARLRGVEMPKPDPISQLGETIGFVAIPTALVIWWLRVWNRRAARKAKTVATAKGAYYRSLLLRMSWRYMVVFGILLFVIGVNDVSRYATPEQIERHVAFFWLLALAGIGVVLVHSWTLTKKRFSQQPPSEAV